MILKYLSAMWTAVAPALGNHLWQSTLFAVTAGFLTLILRKNHARSRYWLWLAASLKFLMPFSLLVGIGSQLAWSRASVGTGTKAGLYFAMEEVSQPFTHPTMSMVSRATPSTLSQSLIHLLPALLVAAWLCGLVIVPVVWYVRWRRIAAAIREAVPLEKGREVEALCRLERIAGTRQRIEILSSRASLEPGIFGIARPVLVWPEGISERLDDAHLDAVLAHELWHVRRRDNLAAAIHMVVEAMFWFHPLVWWLGARLMDERERACDEEVLALGSEPQVYAESILKTCEFCVGFPLSCVSGVTGADLKKRIVRIMTEAVARKLDFRRKFLLTTAGLLAVAGPVVFGLLHATPSQASTQTQDTATAFAYEVASIRPNKSGGNTVRIMSRRDGLTATGATLKMLIKTAYQVEDHQIAGAPNWFDSEKYDIEAKVDRSVAEELPKLSEDRRALETQRMLQALLADRLKLTLHRETKELPVYELVIVKNGPKLQEAKPGDPSASEIKRPDGLPAGPHTMRMSMEGGARELTGQGLPVASLVRLLSGQLHRTVLDKTGLTAKYNFTLKWTADQSVPMFRGTEGGQPAPDTAPPPESSGPSLFTAIQEQLGLKLESQKGPVEIIVIDHVEKPSEN